MICMLLYTSLLHNATPICCTPLPLHPTVMNTQIRKKGARRPLSHTANPRVQRCMRQGLHMAHFQLGSFLKLGPIPIAFLPKDLPN